GEQDLRLRCARCEHLRGYPGVLRELAELAVDRHEVARPHQREHQLHLLFTAMARHVHMLDALVNHVRPTAGEMIDDATDRLFVPWNRTRREDDGVVR